MEALGFLGQEIDHLGAMCEGLGTRDEAALDGYGEGGQAETATARGDNVAGGIALACETGCRMGEVVEIAEGLLLDEREQLIVADDVFFGTRVVRRRELIREIVHDTYAQIVAGFDIEGIGCEIA